MKTDHKFNLYHSIVESDIMELRNCSFEESKIIYKDIIKSERVAPFSPVIYGNYLKHFNIPFTMGFMANSGTEMQEYAEANPRT